MKSLFQAMIKKSKLIVIVISVLLIMFFCYYISLYFYQFVLVQGKSMEPTISSISLCMIDKRNIEIDYYDIVAFSSDINPNRLIIKRVYGLPGDSVLINEGKLYINGEEFYTINNEPILFPGIASKTLSLKKDEFFLMGDNLAESNDSRSEKIGLISNENIKGKIILILNIK